MEAERYDVVLMDVQTELDGLEATRRTRRRRPGPPPRIVTITGNAMQDDREECLAAGMDNYLAKPIRVPEPQAALERARGELAECAPPPGGRPYLDEKALDALRQQFGEGGDAFVGERIDTFLAEGPEVVATLRRGVERGEPDEVRRAAHTLKGNGQTLGAGDLASLCRELEELAKQGTLDAVAELAARVGAEHAQLERALGAARSKAAR